MKKFLCFFLISLLLAGCSSPAEDPTGPTGAAAVPVTIYLPNDNADGFVTREVSIQPFSVPILDQLKTGGVLTEDVDIQLMTMEDGVLTLDFNQAFGDLVCSMGTAGEYMILGSVVNTFLSAESKAESVMITVDGKVLETGHNIYDTPLSFYE